MVIFCFSSSGSPTKDSIVGYFSAVSSIIREALCELGSSVGAAGASGISAAGVFGAQLDNKLAPTKAVAANPVAFKKSRRLRVNLLSRFAILFF